MLTARMLAILGLVVAAMFQACGQICFKLAAEQKVANAGPVGLLRRACRNPWIFVGIVCFAVQALLYTLIIRRQDLSIAFPFGSLCFVAIALLSKVLLHEKVSLNRWIGVVLILLGALVLGLEMH